MMNKLFLLFSLILFTSCGSKLNHKVDVKPVAVSGDVQIGPNFEQVAKFCDERYGFKSEEAEQCFKDYREFYKIKIDISSFCDQKYVELPDIQSCQQELLDILDLINNRN